jgi:hypothetical protein
MLGLKFVDRLPDGDVVRVARELERGLRAEPSPFVSILVRPRDGNWTSTGGVLSRYVGVVERMVGVIGEADRAGVQGDKSSFGLEILIGG